MTIEAPATMEPSPYENPLFFYYLNPITCAWIKRGQEKGELGYSARFLVVILLADEIEQTLKVKRDRPSTTRERGLSGFVTRTCVGWDSSAVRSCLVHNTSIWETVGWEGH